MINKKLVLMVLSVFTVLILLAGCTTTVTPKEKQTVIISGHPDWGTLMSANGDQSSGTSVEMCKDILTQMGYKIETPNLGSWEAVQQAAKIGKVDVIPAIYKTKEREEYLVYSIAYTSDPVVPFSKKGKGFVYNKKEDLVDKRIVATTGDSYGQEIDDFMVQAKMNVIRVDSSKEAFDLVKNDQADCFLYSQWAGEKVLKDSGLSSDFEWSGVISKQPFYVAFSKESPVALRIDEFNSLLREKIVKNQTPST
ncbi:transporter substrate-binding domain-containing protein [bacterium]|jgi:ABC-type amino acid transport substrate-binding protein|nr:transporter substrate-binding domain-containing protein [bacterium]